MADVHGKPFVCNARFIKFLLVGVLNTLVGYGIYVICLWIGLHYSISLAVATILGTLFNFKSFGALVFGSKDNSLVFRFIAVYCVAYVINVLGVGMLFHLGVAEWLGGMVLLLPLALLSYFLNGRFVFRS